MSLDKKRNREKYRWENHANSTFQAFKPQLKLDSQLLEGHIRKQSDVDSKDPPVMGNTTHKRSLKLSGNSETSFLATCFKVYEQKFPGHSLPPDQHTFFNKIFSRTDGPVLVKLTHEPCKTVKEFFQSPSMHNKVRLITSAPVIAEKIASVSTKVPPWNCVTAAIAKMADLFSPHGIPSSLILESCRNLPPVSEWHTKNGIKVAVRNQVSDELIKEAMEILVEAGAIAETNGIIRMIDHEGIGQKIDGHFLQWFLYEYAGMIRETEEAKTSLPFLLDNLLSFTSFDAVLKFIFRVHEDRINVTVTSMYIHFLCHKLQSGDLELRMGLAEKLLPFFTPPFQPGPVSIDDLYKAAIQNSEVRSAPSGLPRDVYYFNFDTSSLEEVYADRADVVSKIENELVLHDNTESFNPLVFVCYGLPGSGKTTFVKQYIRDKLSIQASSAGIASPFRTVIWLEAQSEDLLKIQLAGLYRSAFHQQGENLPGRGNEIQGVYHINDAGSSEEFQEKHRNATMHQINTLYNHLLKEPSFIVLDDATFDEGNQFTCSPSDFIPNTVSSSRSQIVFITTKNANSWLHLMQLGAHFLHFSGWETEESVLYICERLGRHPYTRADIKDTTELVNYLERFPLALKTACDLIQQTNSTKFEFSHDQVYTPARLLNDLKSSETTQTDMVFHSLHQRWLDLDSIVHHAEAKKVGLAILDILVLIGLAVPAICIFRVIRNKLIRPDIRYFHQILRYLEFCSLIVVEPNQRLTMPKLLRLCRVAQLTENRDKYRETLKLADLISNDVDFVSFTTFLDATRINTSRDLHSVHLRIMKQVIDILHEYLNLNGTNSETVSKRYHDTQKDLMSVLFRPTETIQIRKSPIMNVLRRIHSIKMDIKEVIRLANYEFTDTIKYPVELNRWQLSVASFNIAIQIVDTVFEFIETIVFWIFVSFVFTIFIYEFYSFFK